MVEGRNLNMEEVKLKISTALKKGKAKKKTKNYIQENVKQLKKFSQNRLKSEDKGDGRRVHDRSISYAERLKAATSSHLKLIQNLTYLKDVNQQNQTKRKKVNVFTMQSKVPLAERSSNALPEIKQKRPLKAVRRRAVEELKMENKVVEPKAINKSNTSERNEHAKYATKIKKDESATNEIKLEKKNITLTDKRDSTSPVKPVNRNDNSRAPSEAVISDLQQSHFAKGYKNEACQAHPMNSNESIDSNAVIRFPRKPFNKDAPISRATLLCEKSLQTELKQTLGQTSASSSKKNKVVIKTPNTTINKDISKMKDTLLSTEREAKRKLNEEKSLVTVSRQANQPSRIPQVKMKLKPHDEKANVLLNEIINASNVDVKKLHSEIRKVHRTSPFARHHTVFEERSPEDIRKEHSKNMKNNPVRAPGTVVLPDHKRKEYLAQIKKRHTELLKQLNSMPINSKSPEVRQQKLQIDQALIALDNAIKIFSKDQLLIDLNTAESIK